MNPIRTMRTRQPNSGTTILRVPPKLTSRRSYIKYIEVDLWSWLKDLSTSMLKINFKDNFQSFTVDNLTIPASTEVSIPNAFRTAYPGTIPSGRIIIRQSLSSMAVLDGDTEWTDTHVYLKNADPVNAVKVSVLFFK